MDEESLKGFKLEVKAWLKTSGRDYAWLASKCYVSEYTVRNWMARREIPLAKQDIIRRLMERDQAPLSDTSIEVESETLVSMRLSSDVRYNLERLADEQGVSLETFILHALTGLCTGGGGYHSSRRA